MPRRGEPNADLDSVVSEISQQVRLLDGLVRYRFGGNAELMGAWANARNVQGPFRSHGEPAAGWCDAGSRQAGGVSPHRLAPLSSGEMWSSPPGPFSLRERGNDQPRRGGWRVYLPRLLCCHQEFFWDATFGIEIATP